MKQRSTSSGNRQRPDAPQKKTQDALRKKTRSSAPRGAKRNESTLPADRGAYENESLSQGSE
jgi:hypothetical protein